VNDRKEKLKDFLVNCMLILFFPCIFCCIGLGVDVSDYDSMEDGYIDGEVNE